MTNSSKDQSIKNFIRGGQIILHNARMFTQIMSGLMLSCLLIFIVSTITVAFLQLSSYERYMVLRWAGAKASIKLFGKNATQQIEFLNGKNKKILSVEIIKSPRINNTINKAITSLIIGMIVASVISLLYFLIIYRYLRKQGETQSETQQIRGDVFVESKELKKIIEQTKAISDIKTIDLPMPKNFECRHTLMHGSIGTGKSELIKGLLDQIRKRGDKVIIYDKGCDYTRYYYQKDKDIILNALDDRGLSWHLWNECRDFADFDNLAAALIPHAPGGADPFWVNAARTIFAATARQMEKETDRSIIKLLQTLLSADLDQISDFLKGTEAESLVSKKIEKTAISIKSILAASLKSLKYIKDDSNGFSIRKWINDDHQSNWLFVSSLADRHETIKPLITMWLDIAINALMSLEPSPNRRIWFILDELPTLNKLPYLVSSLAEARKFGGCFVLGIQSIAQLREIYGLNGAENISGLSNSKFFLRSPSFETAQWVSRELGQKEIEEVREGISYSESAMRSGISISKQHLNRQIVSSSEIMTLKDLEAYVRVPGGYPITKIIFSYQQRNKIAEPFISRSIKDISFELGKSSEIIEEIPRQNSFQKTSEVTLG